jgi:precorrin-4 methylase
MTVKKLIAAVAVFVAAGSAFAQQTEFVKPDADFKSTLTRAEVRQEMAQAYSEGQVAQRRHDGQDMVYGDSTRSRDEVRAEAAKSTQSHEAGNLNSIYFG